MSNFDLIELLEKGGLLVWPILICSLVGASIFLERLFLYRRVTNQFKNNKDLYLVIQNGEFNVAIEWLERFDTADAVDKRILLEALQLEHPDRETIEMVLIHGVQKEITRLARTLSTLAVLASVSPLLGLLGTVIGMIKAFMVVETMGGGVNATVLAGGIWEAMLTTAVGLVAAIPMLFFHNHLENRLTFIETKLQDIAVIFLKYWTAAKNPG